MIWWQLSWEYKNIYNIKHQIQLCGTIVTALFLQLVAQLEHIISDLNHYQDWIMSHLCLARPLQEMKLMH